MSSVFVPMYSSMPCHYQTRRPRRRCPASMYQQPSLLDVILSGVLSQLHADQTASPSHTQTRQRPVRRPWIHRVDLTGFKPEDLSVKVEDNIVHVTAKHVTETDTGRDVMEKYRKVIMPEDVDVPKLGCFLDDRGNLIMKASFVSRCPADQECNTSKNDKCCKKSPEQEKAEKSEGKTDNLSPNNDMAELPIDHQGDGVTVKQSTNVDTSTESRTGELQTTHGPGDGENQEPVPIISEVESDTEIEGETESVKTSLPTNDYSLFRHDDLTSERSFDVLDQNTVSPPPSPHESLDFVIFNGDGEETSSLYNNQPCGQITTSENMLENQTDGQLSLTQEKHADDAPITDTSLMESIDQAITIKNVATSPASSVIDTTRVRDVDGQKQFEITLNLQHYKPEETSIWFKDDCLQIEAENETQADSLKSSQRIYREYKLPKQGQVENAEAAMNNDGILRVTVPLNMDN